MQHNQMIMVPLGKIVDHKGHDRTREDPMEMARLTLQVHTRGLDPHQPIVVTDGGDGTFPAIAGHRRRTAALLNEEIKARTAGDGVEVDLDVILQIIADLVGEPGQVEVCAECGSRSLGRRRDLGREPQALCQDCREWVSVGLEDAISISPAAVAGLHDELAERHGQVEVPVALFEGDEKAQILTLQADNFGQEEPDLLGQARSFAAAQAAGATAAEIAGNIGRSTSYVSSVLALNEMPEPLQEAIVDGDYALGVASQIARLQDDAQRQAMVQAVLNSRRLNTVRSVRKIVSGLLNWQPPGVPLDPDLTPDERNQARLVAALWVKVLEENPQRAWKAAIRSLRGSGSIHPSWLMDEGEAHEWLSVLVDGCTCEQCQLREVLAQASPILQGVHSIGCRRLCEDDPKACMHGVFAGDPFYVQLPWGWDDYPGAKRDRGFYPHCDSPEDFRAAVEAYVEEQNREDEGEDDGYSGYVPPPRAQEAGDVAQQRKLIADYVQRHADLSGAKHPWATCCANCQYRLDSSPTKDPDVPHCQWAARRRVIQFFVRSPVDGEGPEIPWCRQFAPTQSWNDLIPTHPEPPGVPREWMMVLVRSMAHQVKRDVGHNGRARQVCEMLTGRPMRASDSHGDWFTKALEREIGNLSDGQLWTLALWAGAEWLYRFNPDRRWQYLLPMPDGRTVWYQDQAWEIPETEDKGQ